MVKTTCSCGSPMNLIPEAGEGVLACSGCEAVVAHSCPECGAGLQAIPEAGDVWACPACEFAIVPAQPAVARCNNIVVPGFNPAPFRRF